MIVYNNFNESKQYDKIIKLLESGNNIALVTDAGTPCISDPGYLLVNECRKKQIDVFSIFFCLPGPLDRCFFRCLLGCLNASFKQSSKQQAASSIGFVHRMALNAFS